MVEVELKDDMVNVDVGLELPLHARPPDGLHNPCPHGEQERRDTGGTGQGTQTWEKVEG